MLYDNKERIMSNKREDDRMVQDFLNRSYEECKTEYEKRTIQLEEYRRQLEDTCSMLEVMEKSKDSEGRIFSPYEEDSYNIEKICQLQQDQETLRGLILETENDRRLWESRYQSLKQVIDQWEKETKILETKDKTESIISKLEYCVRLTDMDPVRCKLELQELIKNLKQELLIEDL